MRRKWEEAREREAHENHLPNAMLFIVCAILLLYAFKAKFMSASCVIVHQLMNGASHNVPIKFNTQLILSLFFTFAEACTPPEHLRVLRLCVATRARRRKRKKKDFSLKTNKFQRLREASMQKENFCAIFSAFLIMQQSTARAFGEPPPRRERYVHIHSHWLFSECFFHVK